MKKKAACGTHHVPRATQRATGWAEGRRQQAAGKDIAGEVAMHNNAVRKAAFMTSACDL